MAILGSKRQLSPPNFKILIGFYTKIDCYS